MRKFSVVICLLFLSGFVRANSFAYSAGTLPGSPLPSININFDVLKKITNTIPVNLTGGLPTVSGVNWNIFQNSSFSTSDLTGALKSIAVLAINLFLIVIQTVAGILKAFLPFLNK